MSTGFRYVDKNGVPKERLFKFNDISKDRTVAANFSVIAETINAENWGEKIVAQSYDGTSVMAGELSGVQAIMKEVFPNARYIRPRSFTNLSHNDLLLALVA